MLRKERGIALLQRLLGVNTRLARQRGSGKQQLSHCLLRHGLVRSGDGGLGCGGDVRRCGCCFHAAAGCALLQLSGTHQRRQRTGHALQVIGQCQAALFLILERIPVFYALVPTKNVRMAVKQLAADTVADLCKGEMPGLPLDLRMNCLLYTSDAADDRLAV